ncbi:thiamine biosynthesis lipoprotein [Natranaerovirga pectinivora]|uniref:FAD:protein FMN transferase n=1 Tax=Natranaerovirga pectinivora TaxID=682400 RepID=A0A4V2V052_9FIRM|nr:FAD:protein FMN transferase [Natranaerovirga pectinivora]TCT14001.1 thiamine biosynthesis lipoprotein [Natranaerovirga pectinivora]
MRKLKILLICCISFVLVACNERLEQKSDITYALGTISRITIFDKADNDSEKYFKAISDLIKEKEKVFSKNLEISEVSMINLMSGQGPITVSEEMAYLLLKSKEHALLSDGLFDITIGPIINLWDIGGTEARVPGEEEIKELLPYVDYTKIRLNTNNNEVELLQDNMVIDLGGIAKGYIADQAAEYMKELGIKHGIVNLGGDIVTIGGKPDGTPWRIGVQNPQEGRGETIGVISSFDNSIVTSGIYERFVLGDDDVIYHHMIDPRTGYPFENELASVTIVSEFAIDGDALSTAVYGMGLEKGYLFVEALENIDAVFITKENEVYITTALKDRFELTNKHEFILKEW